MMDKKKIGLFENISGRFVVSDPCYDAGTWCAGVLEGVKKGLWCAFVTYSDEGKFGIRISELVAIYSALEKDVGMVAASFVVGVDSGQAGVFDAEHYKPKNKNWYYDCCDKTLSNEQAGIIPYGVASSSGCGDGTYKCTYGVDNNGEIVKVCIKFI